HRALQLAVAHRAPRPLHAARGLRRGDDGASGMNRTDGMKEVRVGADLRLLIDGAYTSGHLFEVSAEHHDAFVSQDVQGTGCATLHRTRSPWTPDREEPPWLS